MFHKNSKTDRMNANKIPITNTTNTPPTFDTSKAFSSSASLFAF